MHETTIMDQVVRLVQREKDRRGASAVVSVDVEVGELEGLRVEDLKRAFDVRVEGTTLDEAVLHVRVVPATVFCPACCQLKLIPLVGVVGQAAATLACPDCGSAMEVEGGRGFAVRSATMVLPA